MKTKHTPGTWHAHDGQIYPEETGKTLALIPHFDAENKEQEANALLIAAAPEMAEALLKAYNCFKRLASEGNYPSFMLAENGGDGFKFMGDALLKAGIQP